MLRANASVSSSVVPFADNRISDGLEKAIGGLLAARKAVAVARAIELAASRGPAALPPSSADLAGHGVTDADVAKIADGLAAGGVSLTGLDLSGAWPRVRG